MRTFFYGLLAALLLPATAFSSEQEMAKIVTHMQPPPANCISPVKITHIDGERRMLPELGFDLESGHHTLSEATTYDSGDCFRRLPEGGRPENYSQVDTHSPLEAVFEAGKTYYVGMEYDPESSYMNGRGLIVWKIKSADGEVEFDLTETE
jgi:hypothetical protein